MFPRTVTTASDARAQLQAMTCASESISLITMDEKELLSGEVEADKFFIILPVFASNFLKRDFEDVRETEAYVNNRQGTKPRVVKSYNCNCVGLSVETKIHYF